MAPGLDSRISWLSGGRVLQHDSKNGPTYIYDFDFLEWEKSKKDFFKNEYLCKIKGS
jgi:hypothetical protein